MGYYCQELLLSKKYIDSIYHKIITCTLNYLSFFSAFVHRTKDPYGKATKK